LFIVGFLYLHKDAHAANTSTTTEDPATDGDLRMSAIFDQ
jgi:hypothetical protein